MPEHIANEKDDCNCSMCVDLRNAKPVAARLGTQQGEVRCINWLGEWAQVPPNIAKCPDCGAPLEAWVDGWSEDGGYTIELQCTRGEDQWHECLQSEWQPVMDVVKAWANSPSDANSHTPHRQPEQSKGT